jgi:predicted metal-binding membrane protein
VTTTPAARDRRRVRVPLFLIAGTAWLVLAVAPLPMAMGGHDASEPVHDMVMPGPVSEPFSPILPGTLVGLADLVPSVALMVVAMMWPLLGPAIGHVRARTLARRRREAVTSFLMPYTLVWAVAGTVLAGVAAAATAVGPNEGVLLAAVIAVVLVWQVSPAKQRCLNRTHRHPELSAFGPAAVTGVVRFGTTHALWCVGSCWALMLVPFVVPAWHLPAMAVVALCLARDRLATPTRPRWFPPRRDRRRRLLPAHLRKPLRVSARTRSPADRAVHGEVAPQPPRPPEPRNTPRAASRGDERRTRVRARAEPEG